MKPSSNIICTTFEKCSTASGLIMASVLQNLELLTLWLYIGILSLSMIRVREHWDKSADKFASNQSAHFLFRPQANKSWMHFILWMLRDQRDLMKIGLCWSQILENEPPIEICKDEIHFRMIGRGSEDQKSKSSQYFRVCETTLKSPFLSMLKLQPCIRVCIVQDM